MKKIWILFVFFLSLVSCGTYKTTSYGKVRSILAITEQGDTIAVPYRDFLRERNDFYPDYRIDNNWYWNRWSNPYWTNNWWYWNNYDVRTYSVPARNYIRPKVKPKPRPRINDQPERPIERSRRETQGRNNGRRSGYRQELPSRQTPATQPRQSQSRQIRRGQGTTVLRKPRTSQPSGQQGRRRIDQ